MTNTYKFGIKNINRTWNKWGGYKTKLYHKITSGEWEQDQIEKHIETLVDYGLEYVVGSTYAYDLIEEARERKASKRPYKAIMNQVKTQVNKVVRQMNEGLVDFLSGHELSKREMEGFAIRFYLEKYETINKAMGIIMKKIEETL